MPGWAGRAQLAACRLRVRDLLALRSAQVILREKENMEGSTSLLRRNTGRTSRGLAQDAEVRRWPAR